MLFRSHTRHAGAKRRRVRRRRRAVHGESIPASGLFPRPGQTVLIVPITSTGRVPQLDAQFSIAGLEDGGQLEGLSEWLGRWDPCLSIELPRRDAALYDSDATLYGIALGGPLSIDLYHRPRTIHRGDAVVVPQGLAIEVQPEADLVLIRSTGTPPSHFRERFVRVWGYEHFPAAGEEPSADEGEFREVIPESDARFPFHYTIRRCPPVSANAPLMASETDLTLLVNLDAQPVGVEIPAAGYSVELPDRHLLGIQPGTGYRFFGPGRVSQVRLVSEPVFIARSFLARSKGTER